MAWFLQTPDGASPKLLAKILAELGPAVKGGAAFAFASAQGVTAEEIETELLLNPVLIAEVPKSGDRWKQVNFDIQTY
jgi:hypothetical protein